MAERRTAYTLKGIDPGLWRLVKSAAALKGQTLNEWILEVIRKAVKR
jgi:predicted HicB family RNase H-like nuclease